MTTLRSGCGGGGGGKADIDDNGGGLSTKSPGHKKQKMTSFSVAAQVKI
jgi:hypothetical protein